jgi:hypothetical protein
MTVTVTHEPDRGFRSSKDGISILHHTLMVTKRSASLTNSQVNDTSSATNTFLTRIGMYDPEAQNLSQQLTSDSFPDVDKDACLYKYVSEETLAYMRKGSFQFGSIQYYRDIERQESRDKMEGLTNLLISTQKNIIGTALVSGYNFAIFCGATGLEKRDQMTTQFGDRIIRISNLKKFCQCAMQSLGGLRVRTGIVSYNDLKLFRTKTLKSLKNIEPNKIDNRTFDYLCKTAMLPSLFMKPTRFSNEQELRLAFELPKDLPAYVRIENSELAALIEEVD